MMHIVAFTAKGAALAQRLQSLYPQADAHAPQRYCLAAMHPLECNISDWTRDRFAGGNALVYIGAAGIAVRAMAPFVESKATDPAVLCLDDGGRFVIPLLSGHLGGGNRLAREIAEKLGTQAVVTTATDGSGVFSADGWAAAHGCAVVNLAMVKEVSAALLDGTTVGFACDFPVNGPLPYGLAAGGDLPLGIHIGLEDNRPFPRTLWLVPRCIVAGMGCRKGVDSVTLKKCLCHELSLHGLPLQAVGAVASIDLKAGEPGLLELCRELSVPLLTYPAAVLMAQKGQFTPSRRVLEVTGADNVCERAAVAAGGSLFSPKSAGDGVTVALARREWRAEFANEGELS